MNNKSLVSSTRADPMNSKLIHEILKDTDNWCNQNLPKDWTDRVDEYLPVWNNKFAELIVKECIDIVSTAEFGYTDYRSQIERGMRDYCEALLKKAFGVEE